MRLKSYVAGACAAAIMVCAFSVLPADARAKKYERYREQPRSFVNGAQSAGSYDGRVTGRPRTCGYDSFQYVDRTPVGPYCH